MDILAARKKAAERARAAKAAEESGKHAPTLPEEPSRPPEPAIQKPRPIIEPAAETEPRAGTLQSGKQEAESAQVPDSQEGEASTPEQEQELEMLGFLLGSEEYVVMVDQVKEVLKLREITPVPHTSGYILGVCSLRGTVLPIIDLNRRLGVGAGTRDEKSRIIVVGLENNDEAGLLVDRVNGVVRFSPDAVRPAPETVEQGAGAEFLKGIARKDDKLYILLDVEKAVGA